MPQWGSRDANNALAGLLAGCVLAVMAVTALPPVRRRSYKLFKLAHWLWPALIALAIIHTQVGAKEEGRIHASASSSLVSTLTGLGCAFFPPIHSRIGPHWL